MGKPKILEHLDSIDSQLADIAINIKSLGVIPNDNTKASANAIAINNFFSTNQNKTLLCTNDNYYIDDTIIVTGRNKLVGQKSTKFILMATDKDAIRVRPFSGIESVSIELPASHNKAAIHIYDDVFSQWDTHYLSYIKDIFIYGNITGLSDGIVCESSDGFAVTNFTADNVTILNCNRGIYCAASGTGWVNGNNFINIYPQNCKYGIYEKCAGNKYIYSIQMGAVGTSQVGIYCGGNENTFIGKVWDAVTGQLAIETSPSSVNNTFSGQSFVPNTMQYFVKNKGTNNTFVGDTLSQSIPAPLGAYRYDNSDSSKIITPTWANHNGFVDDILAFADKYGTVSTTLGDTGVISGTRETLFSNKGITYGNTAQSNPIVLEITLPTAKNFCTTFGITFHTGLNAKRVKMEYASSSGGAYTTAFDVTDNEKESLIWSFGAYGLTVQKIKVTVSEGYINPTTNPNGYIGIWNIFMFANGQNGNFYLPRNGGDIYGDMKYYASTVGPVLKDTTNGHTYRLTTTNGALVLVQVT